MWLVGMTKLEQESTGKRKERCQMSFWIKGSAVHTKAATTVIQDQDLPLIIYLKDIPSNYHNLEKGFWLKSKISKHHNWFH